MRLLLHRMVARETSLALGLSKLGIPAVPSNLVQLEALTEILRDEAIPLGYLGPNEARRIVSRHVLECAAASSLVPDGVEVADVGSGAGLPGLVLACLGRSVVLVEASARRADFLRGVISRLELDAEVIQDRAEQVARSSRREGFAAVTARALGGRAVALELCMPLAVVGGKVLLLASRGKPGAGSSRAAARGSVMSGQVPWEEATARETEAARRSRDAPRGSGPTRELGARRAADEIGPGGAAPEPADGVLGAVAAELGGGRIEWSALAVPGAEGPRWVMIVEKVRPTPERYPRRAGVPQRRPLG